jgi:hypothetical protein
VECCCLVRSERDEHVAVWIARTQKNMDRRRVAKLATLLLPK